MGRFSSFVLCCSLWSHGGGESSNDVERDTGSDTSSLELLNSAARLHFLSYTSYPLSLSLSLSYFIAFQYLWALQKHYCMLGKPVPQPVFLLPALSQWPKQNAKFLVGSADTWCSQSLTSQFWCHDSGDDYHSLQGRGDVGSHPSWTWVRGRGYTMDKPPVHHRADGQRDTQTHTR